MALSNSTNFTETRIAIITRALRQVGGVGQGETPNDVALTEANQALNDLVKAWAADGMPLWAIEEYHFSPVVGQRTYRIGKADFTGLHAPLKVIQAWLRDNCGEEDTPVVLITRHDYNLLGNKFSLGQSNLIWYDPPRALATDDEMVGSMTLFPTPDVYMVTHKQVYFTGQRQFYDLTDDDENPDFPSYWYNAVTWGLADQLSYEYHVPPSERAMISKKALQHKLEALSFGTEEGSFRIQPSQYAWSP